MKKILIAFLTVVLLCNPSGAALTPDSIAKLPVAEIEKQLPNEHPSAYYLYAGRLFKEGAKDEAVFWFYVGQLRYRFHLNANPKLEQSGDPALFDSLSATLGLTINEYAGENNKTWILAIDRALKWDDETPNGFTSKNKFKAVYKENRAGLQQMRDQLKLNPEPTSEQSKKPKIPTYQEIED